MSELIKSGVTRREAIISLHAEIGGLIKTGLEKAIMIGELLLDQKDSLKHGEFTPWIKENLPFTDRTARNYMRLHENRQQLKTENVSVLSQGYKMLSPPKKSEQPKTLLEQQQDLAERSLNLECEAGGAMCEMDEMLTPPKNHYCVGTADDNTVFHIEHQQGGGCELIVYKHGKSAAEKRHSIKDGDCWWYVNKYVGIGKIISIGYNPELPEPELSKEQKQRLVAAAKNYTEDKDTFWEVWRAVGNEVMEKVSLPSVDWSDFVKSARELYGRLMNSFGRLCEVYGEMSGLS